MRNNICKEEINNEVKNRSQWSTKWRNSRKFSASLSDMHKNYKIIILVTTDYLILRIIWMIFCDIIVENKFEKMIISDKKESLLKTTKFKEKIGNPLKKTHIQYIIPTVKIIN